MRFSVLASGSKGNSTYIEVGETRILVDLGVSCKRVELSLKALGVDPRSINAIILTHEHSDHISGLRVFLSKYQTPIFGSAGTLKGSGLSTGKYGELDLWTIRDVFNVGQLAIAPFPISHDAEEPLGFLFDDGRYRLCQATDLGVVNDVVRCYASNVDALILESNHDLEMLATSDYPWHLKERIKSSYGHLSNTQAFSFLKEVFDPKLKCIVLAHLSENNNSWERVKTEVDQFCSEITCNSTHWHIARQYISSPIFDISSPIINSCIEEHQEVVGI